MKEHVETKALLLHWREGDLASRDALIARIVPELEAIAAARLRYESRTSLSTNDLINEAVLRVMRIEPSITDRTQLLGLASRLMRNVLVDQARARNASKREHRKVELETRLEGVGAVDLYRLDSALIRLEAIDKGLAEIVEMRFFGGMTVPEVAEVIGVSEPTVKRRWQTARAWLSDAMIHSLPDA